MSISAFLDPDESDLSRLLASGSWTAGHAEEIDRPVTALATASATATTLDVSAVGELDVFGAWLIERLVRTARAGGRSLELAGTPDQFRDLLDRTGQTNRRPATEHKKRSVIVRLSDALIALASDGLALLAMLGALASNAARLRVRTAACRRWTARNCSIRRQNFFTRESFRLSIARDIRAGFRGRSTTARRISSSCPNSDPSGFWTAIPSAPTWTSRRE